MKATKQFFSEVVFITRGYAYLFVNKNTIEYVSSFFIAFELFPISHLQELTLADRFMVGVYCFIFASFIVTIVMLRLQRENYYYFADVFYSYTEWMVRDAL